jgi:hypothetical protein
VTTPVLTGNSPPAALDVDLTGVGQLDLIVDDDGDGNGSDHSDWADAMLRCAG